MKRHLLALLVLATLSLTAAAQVEIKYGTIHSDSLLQYVPAYAEAQTEIADLRQKFADEINYSEENFRRELAEYLEGQSKFPETILLKRQRDLQDHLTQALAFRDEADSLLRRAESEIMQSLRATLQEAVRAVGIERGYESVFDLSIPSPIFLHPAVTEDATPFVVQKLRKIQ